MNDMLVFWFISRISWRFMGRPFSSATRLVMDRSSSSSLQATEKGWFVQSPMVGM